MTREIAHTNARRYEMAAIMAADSLEGQWICPDTPGLVMDTTMLLYAAMRWREKERGEE